MDPFDLDIPVPHSDGSFISEKMSRIAELVREYDPALDVKWIPRGRRAPDDDAVVITETRNGREFVVMSITHEEDFDERVLERIYQADNAKHGNILTQMDIKNAAVRAVIEKKHEEQRAEAIELAHSILKSPLHTYKHNGKKYT